MYKAYMQGQNDPKYRNSTSWYKPGQNIEPDLAVSNHNQFEAVYI